jgi:hypothetical protein
MYRNFKDSFIQMSISHQRPQLSLFFKDKKGEIKHFIVQVGFGIWRFDKIK